MGSMVRSATSDNLSPTCLPDGPDHPEYLNQTRNAKSYSQSKYCTPEWAPLREWIMLRSDIIQPWLYPHMLVEILLSGQLKNAFQIWRHVLSAQCCVSVPWKAAAPQQINVSSISFPAHVRRPLYHCAVSYICSMLFGSKNCISLDIKGLQKKKFMESEINSLFWGESIWKFMHSFSRNACLSCSFMKNLMHGLQLYCFKLNWSFNSIFFRNILT